jgi:anti-anti-sigma factor
MNSAAAVWHDCSATLLRSSRLIPPSGVADAINEAVAPIGIEVTVYLVDREQLALRALPRSGKPLPDPIPIDTTLPGRAFTTGQLVQSPNEPERVWLMALDGSDRLGVLEVLLPSRLPADDQTVRDGLELLATVVGHMLVTKTPYGDTVRVTRRSKPMSPGGELLWRALPPLTCATADMVLAAVLEPCYEVGGDAFDYAVDDDLLRVGIFDAVGHGLAAALTSTLTLAATRAARTTGLDLPAVAAAADDAITGQFHDLRYATAILAELNLATGVLRYVNAGHPPAVLMRDGKVVASLDGAGRTPLGLPDQAPVAEQHLQPGDRLLFYTDGITEARDAAGRFFGLSRLLDLAERHSAAGLPAPETLRRLAHAVLDHQQGRLDDDATLVIVEWSPDARPDELSPGHAQAELDLPLPLPLLAEPGAEPEPDPDPRSATEILTYTTATATAPDGREVVVASPAGVIGLAGASELERALISYIDSGRSRLVLDLHRVSLVDSAGLTALLRVHYRAADEGGWLRLVNPRSRVRRILQIARLGQLITVHDTVEAAVLA